ncbi:SBBP repeat-containing protein [bacterium]|nr:SBBP repeat-containing protein [bacterium]
MMGIWLTSGVARAIVLWASISLLILAHQGLRAQAPPRLTPRQEASVRPAVQRFQQSAPVFVENMGQWPDLSVRFALSAGGVNVGLTSGTLKFQLMRRETPTSATARNDARRGMPFDRGMDRPGFKGTVFTMRLAGARAVMPAGDEKTSATINFRRGDPNSWREAVPTWNAVSYKNVYDGIDLRVESRAGGIKYQFEVAPGADPRKIEFQYDGIAGLAGRPGGALEVTPAKGWSPLIDDAPVAWQESGGQRRPVAIRFAMRGEKSCGFEITGPYDSNQGLTIDPKLVWSAYLGGSGDDEGNDIALDESGNVYVTGRTASSGWTSGGFDTSFNGNSDAFVAKLSSAGGLIWSTYLGGGNSDEGDSIAIDGSGNVFVTGPTASSGWTSGGFDTSFNGGSDGFVMKMSSSGQHLWSTYLGGSQSDTGNGIAVDGSGNVFVTGETASSGWISGGFDTSYNGNSDAYVMKMSSSGKHLWSTYLGGIKRDTAIGIALDGSGNVFATGYTESSGWTSGGFDTSYNGYLDAFVAKLSNSGGHLWSTYLGGSRADWASRDAVDGSGNVYVTGFTQSSGWTSGGFDTSYNGDGDAYVAKLSSSGKHLWSTYLGGGDVDYGWDIALDISGNVYVTGDTKSSGWMSGGFEWLSFQLRANACGPHTWATPLKISDGGSPWISQAIFS